MDKNKYDRIYTHILTDKEAIECGGEKLTILTLQLTDEKHRASAWAIKEEGLDRLIGIKNKHIGE